MFINALKVLSVLWMLFIKLSAVKGVFTQQNTYKAAVLEYAPKLSGITPADNILRNTKEYVNYMLNARQQGVEIIVFPEYGLTGWDIGADNLAQVSTEVPEPSDRISPCVRMQHGNYSKFFVDLSCAARNHKVYSVINLIERRYTDNDNHNHNDYDNNNHKVFYHNTNVVFDRKGVVIAKYRKINLFGEPDLESGEKSQLSTFDTDFGVKFATFICFDILFKYPTENLLTDNSITDIAYPVAWLSELPFYHALGIQHGFAKSKGINLLAAGMNDPGSRNGGSGIYLHNGRIEQAYLSGYKSSKLIIRQVPKIRSRRDLSNVCQASSDLPIHVYGDQLPDTTFFRTKQSDLSLYTFKSVNLDEKEISDNVCSKESSFCCSFNITIDKSRDITPNYAYKLVAFYGTTEVYKGKTLGIRNCGVIACLNESEHSCGEKHAQPPTGITFRSISLRGNFNLKDSQQQPSTLNFNLMPSTDYMYCSKTTDEHVEISLSSTKPHDSLLTFGITGRVFNYDDTPVRLISKATTSIVNVYLVFFISIFVFLHLE